MDYDDWIDRERRVRLKLLMDSPVIKDKNIYRICQECGEICLCHEETCPNCNGGIIEQQHLDGKVSMLVEERVRCRFRFEHLE